MRRVERRCWRCGYSTGAIAARHGLSRATGARDEDGEDTRMAESGDPQRKLSRQQLRAQARERRSAARWIAALGTDDPWLKRAIRDAIGTRSVTRAELEESLGMSLEEPRSASRPEPTG
jgi:hypothetical protein